jgi:hypothetical protein
VRANDVGDLPEVTAAFAGRALLPVQVRGVRRPHCLVHLADTGAANDGDDLTGGGVFHDEPVVGGRRRPPGDDLGGGLLIHGHCHGRPGAVISANDIF